MTINVKPAEGGAKPSQPDPARPAAAVQPVKAPAAADTARAPGAGAVRLGPAHRIALTETPALSPRPARVRARHRVAMLGFLLGVIAPILLSAWYLWWVADDQFQSEAAFSVRTEKMGASGGLLGALTQFGASGGAQDGDVLFDFIRSQQMVERIDATLGLDRIYGRGASDPWFGLPAGSTIEEKVDYWHRVVDLTYDTTTDIVTVHARAFAPGDAQAVVAAILKESSALVNALSDQSREDASRASMADLADAEANLRTQRQKMAAFRRENQMIDPQADIMGQAGVLNALQAQLAQAMVERDMVLSYSDANDQRVLQADRKISAIQSRIAEERTNLGMGKEDGTTPSELLGRYEELRVDLEFANAAYTQALANVAVARADARRQARYLVAHVEPTQPTESRQPRRGLLLTLVGLGALFLWMIVFVVFYNVRDMRVLKR